VPKDIRSVVGRTEVVRSLKTSDYREALRRLPLASAEVDARFAEAHRRVRTKVVISLSEHDLRQMVLRWFWREERLLAEKEFSSDRFQWLHREEAIKENLEVLGNLLEPEDPGTLAYVQKAVGDILASECVGGLMGGHWLGPLDWRQSSLREAAPAGPSFCSGCSS